MRFSTMQLSRGRCGKRTAFSIAIFWKRKNLTQKRTWSKEPKPSERLTTIVGNREIFHSFAVGNSSVFHNERKTCDTIHAIGGRIIGWVGYRHTCVHRSYQASPVIRACFFTLKRRWAKGQSRGCKQKSVSLATQTSISYLLKSYVKAAKTFTA